jgi:hypothetical protein
MAHKFTFVCISLAVALIGQAASALDLIELNDVNTNAIGQVDISKALGGVQDAYKNEFRFESTHDLRKFISQCEQLYASMASAQNTYFGGLASQIKLIIAEPSIKQACSVTNEQITADFDELDDLSKGDTIYPPLSTRVFNLLVSLAGKVDSDPVLGQVAGHLVESKIEEVSAKLMSGAPKDVEMMIGEVAPAKSFFDFETKYRKFCKISLIAPICRLVRNTPLEVSAIAADVKKFTAALKSGAAKVVEYIESSGVTLDDLKARCNQLQRHLRPIDQINKYLEAKLINEETIEANREIDPSLDSYVALHDLCQTAAV